DSIKENPKSPSKDGLRIIRIAETPCKAQAWRPVADMADMVLCFVAQAIAQRDVRPNLPVVVEKCTQVDRRNVSQGSPGVEAEQRCAAARSADLSCREPLLLKQQRPLVDLETRKRDRCPGNRLIVLIQSQTGSAEERESP